MDLFTRTHFVPHELDKQETFISHLLAQSRLSPVNAFEYHCTKSWKLIPRRVKESYWSYFLEGTGTCWLKTPENVQQITANQLVLFPENMLHSVTPDPGSEMVMINVRFQLKTYQAVDLLSILKLEGIYQDDQMKMFQQASKSLAREFGQRRVGWSYLMQKHIWDVLISIIRNYWNRNKLAGLPQNLARDFIRLQPVFNMVENRLNDPCLAVTDLAASISLSEVYLRKLFHRLCDCSPVQFIQQQRITRACRQLREQSCPIKKIAADCGFRDLPFFYRVFRKLTGKTPAEYRDQTEL